MDVVSDLSAEVRGPITINIESNEDFEAVRFAFGAFDGADEGAKKDGHKGGTGRPFAYVTTDAIKKYDGSGYGDRIRIRKLLDDLRDAVEAV